MRSAPPYPLTSSRLLEIYRALRRRFGPRGWWPGETPFEIAVGAVLTQNTNWANVERAIDRLAEGGLLDPEAWDRADPADVARRIRPAGYFNLKTKRLLCLVDFLRTTCGGDPSRLARFPPEEARARILAVHGIGPETADSILLYAAGIPTFVVDAYTRRVLARHGFAPPDVDYETLRGLFMRRLPPAARLYNDFHAQFVELGKRFCGTTPRCRGCPLAFLLPAGGPFCEKTFRGRFGVAPCRRMWA